MPHESHEDRFQQLQERINNLEALLRTATDYGARHAQEHYRGRDPLLGQADKTCVIRHTQSLATAITDGCKHIILADAGDSQHTLTANLTIPAGTIVEGEHRKVEMNPGAFSLTVAGRLRTLTVADGTSATFSVRANAGWVEDCAFDNNVRAAAPGVNGGFVRCDFQNFAGVEGTDAFVTLSGATTVFLGWTLDTCQFTGGPGLLIDSTALAAVEGTARNCTWVLASSGTPSAPAIYLSSKTDGMLIEGGYYVKPFGGTPGANAGYIDNVGGVGVSVRGGFLFGNGSGANIMPFFLRTTGDGTVVSGVQARAANSDITNGVLIRADGCIVSGLNLTGEGAGDGINIDGDYNNNILSGNRLTNFDRGIDIESVLADQNIVVQNQLGGNVTQGFRNLGIGTIQGQNVTV